MTPVKLPIDESGRIRLPEDVLRHLGLHPQETAVMELSENGALIRTRTGERPLTDRIASLNLPVGDWDRMEAEIEVGRTP